jgi:hypothetical protein
MPKFQGESYGFLLKARPATESARASGGNVILGVRQLASIVNIA